MLIVCAGHVPREARERPRILQQRGVQWAEPTTQAFASASPQMPAAPIKWEHNIAVHFVQKHTLWPGDPVGGECQESSNKIRHTSEQGGFFRHEPIHIHTHAQSIHTLLSGLLPSLRLPTTSPKTGFAKSFGAGCPFAPR